jgi:hypothetical protein
LRKERENKIAGQYFLGSHTKKLRRLSVHSFYILSFFFCKGGYFHVPGIGLELLLNKF